MKINIELECTQKELDALKKEYSINLAQRYEVDGVDLRPAFKQILASLTKAHDASL